MYRGGGFTKGYACIVYTLSCHATRPTSRAGGEIHHVYENALNGFSATLPPAIMSTYEWMKSGLLLIDFLIGHITGHEHVEEVEADKPVSRQTQE